jgi:predicted nucleic acid-binding protein
MKFTVDASVWVSFHIQTDVNHADARRFLTSVLALRGKIVVPEIVLLEVAAGVARLTRDAGAGQVAAKKVERFLKLKLRGLDTRFLEKAVLLATRHFLRAADALYVAAAREAKSVLITLDGEMRQRSADAVKTLLPAEWLQAYADA